MSETPTPPTDLRVVILNQYYVPDVASTGHLLSELAGYLAEQGVAVDVLATQPSYGPPETWQKCPRRESKDGIDVLRMRTTRFSKDNLVGRSINSITFLGQLLLRVLFRKSRPGEVFLYTTNPPYLGVIGAFVSMFRRHPYVVLLHDSYPQLAVLVGKIRAGGLIEKIWHRLNRSIYGRTKESIVLCKAAQRLVCDSYDVDEKHVHIIHNWADREKLKPIPKESSPIARDNGLVDPFVVLYSGNLGLYYEFETILEATDLLRDDNFRLVLIGAGGKQDWIAKQIEERNLTNALLLPYQPFDLLNESLNACDASLVTIDKGIEGISYPSKLYSSLAIGRPVLAMSPEKSELRELVEECEVGYWHVLGDAEGVAGSIRKMIADPAHCADLGRKARALFEEKFTLEACAKQYAEVLEMARPEAKNG